MLKRISILLMTLLTLLALASAGWAVDDIIAEATGSPGAAIDMYPGGAWSSGGTAFQAGATKKLTSISIYLVTVGTPGGTGVVKIYNCTGTPGTDGATGSLVATSDANSQNGYGVDYYSFTFSGAQQQTLTSGNNYVWEYVPGAGDASNNVRVYYHSGSLAGFNMTQTGAYYANSIYFPFTLYGVNAVTAPTASISAATSITQTTLTGVGSSTDGGGTVTERGILLKAGGTPTTSSYDFKLTSSGTSGAFAGSGMNVTG